MDVKSLKKRALSPSTSLTGHQTPATAAGANPGEPVAIVAEVEEL